MKKSSRPTIEQQFFSIRDLSDMFGKSTKIIREWIKKGQLEGFRSSDSGNYFVSKAAIEKFQQLKVSK